MDKWIPVEERLPETDDWVLAYYKKTDVYQAFMSRSFYADGEWYESPGSAHRITHWMPLPEAPQEHENKPSREVGESDE